MSTFFGLTSRRWRHSAQIHGDTVTLLPLVSRIVHKQSANSGQDYLTNGSEAAYIGDLVTKALNYMFQNPPLEPLKRVR
jgi:hypothetical protein